MQRPTIFTARSYSLSLIVSRHILLLIRLGCDHRLDVVKRLRQPERAASHSTSPADSGLDVGRIRDEAGDRSLHGRISAA